MTAMIVDELARIPMSPHLAATLTRAADYAVAQQHPEVTLEHLLLALAEDQEASIVLTTSQVDLGRLAADVSDYLSRAQEQAEPGQQGPRISNDLRRILEAAAAAAQQGRRREINGAIVLAAIVGDGKSAAAHMLRAQGLTFEEAIKALQRVVSPPRTEDVLASARERVQSRSLPAPIPAPVPAPAPAPMPEPARAEPPMAERAPAPRPYPSFPEREQQSPEPMPDQGYAAPNGWAPPPQSQQSSQQPRPQPTPQGQQAPGGRIAIPRANHTPAPPSPAPAPAPAPSFPQHGARPAAPGPMLPPPVPPLPAPDHMGPADYGAPAPMAAPPPWSDPLEAQHPSAPFQRPSAPAPSMPAPSAAPAAPAPPMRRRASGGSPVPIPGAAAAANVDHGKLVENIPRKMRRGLPVVAEARIGKADLKALAEGLQGGGAAFHHDVVVTKAMSVRLRAPDGGFWIEPRSPETQWIENVLGLSSEEYASWRWTVTPRTSGKKQLQIIVSARTMGSDGMTADTALPDQIIDVKVGINYGETARRVVGWTLAAIAGGVLARFGDGIFEMAQSVVTRIASGN